jgi:hypothetical protein
MSGKWYERRGDHNWGTRRNGRVCTMVKMASKYVTCNHCKNVQASFKYDNAYHLNVCKI